MAETAIKAKCSNFVGNTVARAGVGREVTRRGPNRGRGELMRQSKRGEKSNLKEN